VAEEAWNRWGQEDERGALNLVGPEETRHAVSLVRSGMAISLAQTMSGSMPAPAQRVRPAHFMGRDAGDYPPGARAPGGFQFADDTMMLPLHLGTHIDCLCHVWYGDKLYNGFDHRAVRSSGSLRCDAVSMGPIATRGVLLDFAAKNGSPLNDGEAIDANRLHALLEEQRITLRKGDAVLIRTGWFERHAGSGTANFNTEPGIDLDAGLILAEAGVALVGADNYAVEVLPFAAGTVFPVHQRLIRDYGIPLLEGLVLEPLADTGVREFLFLVSPLPLKGATASPVAPVAIL
jgi:kynurenine formamidase